VSKLDPNARSLCTIETYFSSLVSRKNDRSVWHSEWSRRFWIAIELRKRYFYQRYAELLDQS
jgi:hypothetical protein